MREGKSKFFLKILSSIPKENYSPISCGYLGISILEFSSEYEDVTFGRMLYDLRAPLFLFDTNLPCGVSSPAFLLASWKRDALFEYFEACI